MPLYTARVRMVPLHISSRGVPWVEMTHHFTFPDDTHALDSIPGLIGAFRDEDIGKRWTCVRGELVHNLTMYRRDITDRRVWARLGSADFLLVPQEEFTIPAPPPFTAADLHWQVGPFFPHTRGAMLIRQTAQGGPVERRIYVGPIAPVCWILEGSVSLPIFGPLPFDLVRLQMDYPIFGDDNYEPGVDTVDVWRESMMDLVRDHVFGLEAATNPHLGVAVVPSWKLADTFEVTKTQASPIRAEIRSRSLRRAMGTPVP